MVFSSIFFLFVFLPFALAVYFGLYRGTQRSRNFTLALLGYAFYAWSSPKFLLIMLGTTVVDWAVSHAIAYDDFRLWRHSRSSLAKLTPGGSRSSFQRYAIAASVVSNLTVLGFFKYFGFATENLTSALSHFGMDHWLALRALRITLPLGISFYTFQSLSYTIDVYRGDAKAMPSFVDFACFVSMFPHLVAGPILKFSFLADQLENRSTTFEKFARGATLFAMGLAKKTLLANPCGEIADLAFGAGSLSRAGAWWGAVSYSAQIYFDFSGYSDMAVGLGLMLGFVFARNFADPYQSSSITEFWRRWHISLSTWLREYLYIPLGGNRRGTWRTYLNLLLTMVLGGLWHGASWNFVIWGSLHGGMLAAERAGLGTLLTRLPKPLRIGWTYLLVLIAWVFFRAPTLPAALRYLRAMFWGSLGTPDGYTMRDGVLFTGANMVILGISMAVVALPTDSWKFTKQLDGWTISTCAALGGISAALLATQAHNPFIYFIF